MRFVERDWAISRMRRKSLPDSLLAAGLYHSRVMRSTEQRWLDGV